MTSQSPCFKSSPKATPHIRISEPHPERLPHLSWTTFFCIFLLYFSWALWIASYFCFIFLIQYKKYQSEFYLFNLSVGLPLYIKSWWDPLYAFSPGFLGFSHKPCTIFAYKQGKCSRTALLEKFCFIQDLKDFWKLQTIDTLARYRKIRSSSNYTWLYCHWRNLHSLRTKTLH